MPPDMPPRTRLATHEVANQPDPSERPGLWEDDRALRRAVAAEGGDVAAVAGFARALEDPETRVHAEAARRDAPRLRAFDRAGRRVDEVAYAPSYHALMQLGIEHGYAAAAWEEGAGPGGHVTHAAMVYLLSQVEPGVCCPLTMTYAAFPALGHDPGLAGLWQPRLAARIYDPALRPVAWKAGVTMGMAMTEKQGGSDVRANTTRAERDGDLWRLTGHKWFCSAPMSDGFLTLAQAPGGLTCFVVPRWLEDGRNAIRLQRLKDKMGDRANASAEIEYEGAVAYRLGEEGEGVRTIIEMVHHTRLDTALAPAGLMRAALAEALWWAERRSAFGALLIRQPLMARVLAEMALDALAATALGFRVAGSFGQPGGPARAFARIGVALAKYLSNKRCVAVVAEAMEVLGGMGYVEDTPMPTLFRQSPLNGIWEGSGNVIALDILRSLAREPASAEALAAELDAARGVFGDYDCALAAHRDRWAAPPDPADARAFAEEAGSLLSAAALIAQARAAPELAAVAEGYVRARLAPRMGTSYGTVPLDTGAILGAVRSPEDG